ncbi:MAG: glycogen/starch/alpha-glucan phosphorylase, partial [Candidatus Cloacimonetes bacterium]|nr:glycogen/starch/alpha-glucan phosphorylase [Candidatus Cloacimonadota bacterium]
MKLKPNDRWQFSSTDISVDTIVDRFLHNLKYDLGKDRFSATAYDCYVAFALTIRDYLTDNWLQYQQDQYAADAKRVYYLSLEFLIGRALSNALINLDIVSEATAALKKLGFNMSELAEIEWDAGLGNGGLGRLAACFLDSLSSLKIPAYGYGIRYEYGIFRQSIHNGYQVESPDNWLRYGTVWEIPQPEHLYPVRYGGQVHFSEVKGGKLKATWDNESYVMAMAYDYMIPGYRNGAVNTLRLWSAKATRDFNLNMFNQGDYVSAVADKNNSEIISKVLYPKDDTLQGKELRLKQEYFFVCATLQDILRRYLKIHDSLTELPQKVAIQLNDTHPAIAIPELMRILVDEKNLPWDKAWDICTKTFAYTNHTILPEALETWTTQIMDAVLPRHLQIIYEINRRFLESLSLHSDNISELSIVQEFPEKAIRMANLAIVGSHSVNGVSALHTELLKHNLFAGFYKLSPGKFNNKTNGITPRRWLILSNQSLTELICDAIGEKWMDDLTELKALEQFTADAIFVKQWGKVKQDNKISFASQMKKMDKIELNPDSIFDFHVKRIHEYKRQLLNALHIIHLALQIRDKGMRPLCPHSFLFAGKAAPGYYMAKLIIKFINDITAWIAQDKELAKLIKVVFLPNYRVSLAEQIMPAAEISQQISMAGTEASGTGNMKFALNGALTVGTLDGANIEIKAAVG